jgi:CheY-like chemotaxis protein
LGLGLAIVKNLVTLHGGTVRALSEGHGRGSEFVVELPTSSMDPHTVEIRPHEEATATRAAGASERVLLVDDNEDAAEMLSEALADLGYVVRTAPDGPSALLVAAEFRPQIALLDIGLPVMDGYELGRRMRDAYPAQALRLVALTGYGHASDKERSREAGFDGHLVKPVDIRNLQRVLDGLCSSLLSP